MEVSHRLTLEGHYGGVLIFLSSSVRAFVELVVCLAFPFMTSSVRLSFAAAHFSCAGLCWIAYSEVCLDYLGFPLSWSGRTQQLSQTFVPE